MAAASERIVVQVTPLEERAIKNTAKRLGLNDSERIEVVIPSTLQAHRALDDALRFIEASNRRIAKLAKGKH